VNVTVISLPSEWLESYIVHGFQILKETGIKRISLKQPATLSTALLYQFICKFH